MRASPLGVSLQQRPDRPLVQAGIGLSITAQEVCLRSQGRMLRSLSTCLSEDPPPALTQVGPAVPLRGGLNRWSIGRSLRSPSVGNAGGDSVSERDGQLATLTATVQAEQQARDADTQHWLSRLSEH